MIEHIFIGLLVLLVFLYIVGPLIILRTQKIPAKVRFERIDEQEFIDSQSDTFNRLSRDIKSIGFDYVGSSALHDSHNVSYFSLFSNMESHVAAMLVTMDNKVKSFTYVEFSQLYADGTMLDVCNSPIVPAYPRMDLNLAARYPDINDANDLYRILMRLKNKLKNSSEPVPYIDEYGFTKVEEFIEKESEELVTLGYCKPMIDADGKRSLTLKGAFLLTWKSVFPGKQISDVLDRKYSKRLLNNA